MLGYWRFFLSAVIVIGLIALDAISRSAQVDLAIIVGVILFGGMSVMAIYESFSITRSAELEVMDRYAQTLIQLGGDRDAWNAMGLKFPHLRMKLSKGKPTAYFGDSHASVEHFVLFLEDSSHDTTVPRRDWNTADRPRWAHEEIIAELEAEGYVLPAAGNQSWRWTTATTLAYLRSYWYAINTKAKNLNDVPGDIMSSPTSRAGEQDEQQLAEAGSGADD